jgi:uncharacterized protein YbjT (DUF2867 family)
VILVTGASGTVGREVLAAVLKTSKPVIAMYRRAEEARHAPFGVATVVADFAVRASLGAALQGVDALFVVCSPIPQLVELESNVIEVAKQAGVRHLVLNSALGAADYAKSFPSWHRKVEEKLAQSGLGFTILRPNTFMQNLVAYSAPSIRAEGVFYSAMGDDKISFIDARDIAAAAAIILADPARHAEKIYELNGPQAFNYTEVAAMLAKIIGSTVKFVNIPEQAQREAMLGAQMPEWQVHALLDLQRYYTVEKKGAELTATLENLLGRPALRLEQYLAENKDNFRLQAARA